MRHILIYILTFLLLPSFVIAENSTNSVFYRNDGADIEIRIVIEGNDDSPWIILQDRDGSSKKVSEKAVIGSKDIAGFSVDDEGLEIHFKLDSWGKILETTRRLKGKRLAFIKDKIILTWPRIFTTLIRSGILDLGKDKADQKRLLKDLSTQPRPAYLNSKEVYMQFQSKWIDLHPNDLETKGALAHQYIDDKQSPDFKKALPLFEALAAAKPKDRMIQARLLRCHFELGQYDHALDAGGNALSTLEHEDQLFIFALLGETHFAMGHRDEATQNLEIYLERLKEQSFPKIEDLLSKDQNSKFENTFGPSPNKTKMLEDVKNRIEYIKTH